MFSVQLLILRVARKIRQQSSNGSYLLPGQRELSRRGPQKPLPVGQKGSGVPAKVVRGYMKSHQLATNVHFRHTKSKLFASA
jgi:hypothetical protein